MVLVAEKENEEDEDCGETESISSGFSDEDDEAVEVIASTSGNGPTVADEDWEDLPDAEAVIVFDGFARSRNKNNCLCHVINLIVKHALKNADEIQEL